jgi:hypothetical protein
VIETKSASSFSFFFGIGFGLDIRLRFASSAGCCAGMVMVLYLSGEKTETGEGRKT